ncbi:MAG: SDR family NAD(P)-dependent oxidoreductase [Rhodobacteraceae bacterium]|nr:SDR family NAD(P)-dependent oxidoreductase [Paracoccaceae bacterium]
MKDANTRQKYGNLSRRDVLAGGAAFAALAAARPAWAQSAVRGAPKVVLITGTSSGFGRLTAEAFARNGLRVVATMREVDGRNAAAAAELRQLGESNDLAIDVVEIDVLSGDSVLAGVAQAITGAGRIDLLVSNAGIVVPGPIELRRSLPSTPTSRRIAAARFACSARSCHICAIRAAAPSSRYRAHWGGQSTRCLAVTAPPSSPWKLRRMLLAMRPPHQRSRWRWCSRLEPIRRGCRRTPCATGKGC